MSAPPNDKSFSNVSVYAKSNNNDVVQSRTLDTAILVAPVVETAKARVGDSGIIDAAQVKSWISNEALGFSIVSTNMQTMNTFASPTYPSVVYSLLSFNKEATVVNNEGYLPFTIEYAEDGATDIWTVSESGTYYLSINANIFYNINPIVQDMFALTSNFDPNLLPNEQTGIIMTTTLRSSGNNIYCTMSGTVRLIKNVPYTFYIHMLDVSSFSIVYNEAMTFNLTRLL